VGVFFPPGGPPVRHRLPCVHPDRPLPKSVGGLGVVFVLPFFFSPAKRYFKGGFLGPRGRCCRPLGVFSLRCLRTTALLPPRRRIEMSLRLRLTFLFCVFFFGFCFFFCFFCVVEMRVFSLGFARVVVRRSLGSLQITLLLDNSFLNFAPPNRTLIRISCYASDVLSSLLSPPRHLTIILLHECFFFLFYCKRTSP